EGKGFGVRRSAFRVLVLVVLVLVRVLRVLLVLLVLLVLMVLVLMVLVLRVLVLRVPVLRVPCSGSLVLGSRFGRHLDREAEVAGELFHLAARRGGDDQVRWGVECDARAVFQQAVDRDCRVGALVVEREPRAAAAHVAGGGHGLPRAC